MTGLLAVTAALLLAQPYDEFGDMPEPLHVQLADQIAAGGYRKVGVLPRFVVRRKGQESLVGSIGPEADMLPERLEEALLGVAKGRFRLVDGRQMSSAFSDITLEDLGRTEVLAGVARKLGGMDALIVGVATDQRGQFDPPPDPIAAPIPGMEPVEQMPIPKPELNVRCRLIDLRDATVAGVVDEDVMISIADAAYMGESWELRRWVGGRMTNRALDLRRSDFPPDQNIEFADWDRELYGLYRSIRPGTPHPLSVADFPYPMSVRVDGQTRPQVPIGGDLYVALDPGDRYEVVVENRSPRDAYLALFIDGMNVLGKKREGPATARFWYLKAGGKFAFSGWYTGSGSQYTKEEFVITPAAGSVAKTQGFGDALGMITAVVMTVGMKDIPRCDVCLAAAGGPSTFATGAGAASDVTLGQYRGEPPGLILAAMTLRYRTSSQLERLKQQGQ